MTRFFSGALNLYYAFLRKTAEAINTKKEIDVKVNIEDKKDDK